MAGLYFNYILASFVSSSTNNRRIGWLSWGDSTNEIFPQNSHWIHELNYSVNETSTSGT